MAVLIPRKQIEEQNDISASFRVGGDLSVTGSAVIGGSFSADSEFFLGNELTDRGEITGSVFLTGSLIIDGDFGFEDVNRVLNVTASQALQSQNTFRYAGILARDFGANVPTLYVSSTDGNDNNDGRTIQFPLRTVKRAAQLATPGFDGRYGIPLGSLFSGYVIRVQAGTYVENNPVILPKNTTIWGSGLRITKINALNPEQDLFHVNSGCYIAEVTMGGLRLFPDQINPERGFAVAFQPGAFITTSPYIQNCSQISNQENSFTELYEDIPPGGGGLYVNGDVINPDSPLASMVLDAYTQISPNGVGCLVNGRGFIQLVSFFTNFSYYAIRVNNGGHATLNNSNISFGLFGMFASGSRKIDAISGGNEDARQRVRRSYSAIVDVLNKGLEDGLPSVTTVNTAEGIKVTQFTQSFSPNLATQTEVNKVSEDFRIISEIVASGPNNYPTLLAKSSDRGYDINNPYNISGGTQLTSSISASAGDLLQISSSYVDLLGIFADGTGSFIFKSNNEDVVKVSNLEPVSASITASAGTTLYNNISSSFDTVIKIVNGGILPTIIPNTSASFYLGDTDPILPSQPISSSIINVVSSSFSIIYNILDKGTGSSILDIPENHQTDFDVVRGTNNSAWVFDGVGNNPTVTLFRGTKYIFNVSGSFAKFTNPFFIRTQPTSGFIQGFDYNTGVINNGDDFGVVTFTVPFNAPNELYYVSQNSSQMVGKFNIVNSSATPFSLIENTMSYPTLVTGSVSASVVGEVTSSYNILNSNLDFLKNETITYISSSWAGFEYNETTCKRDIGYIVDAVANDLLFGGNSGSITAGLEYYLVSSSATTSQKDATLTAIDFLSKTSQNLLRSSSFQQIDTGSSERYSLWNSIIDNKPFIQAETIAYLSSSWSEFEYNQVSCSRDIGFILNAVATDLLYRGNERSVIAGDFYYRFPSIAVTDQLSQTVDGIRYASGTALNIIEGNQFQLAETSTSASVSLLRQNRQLIQTETIEFINATFPTLDYNQVSCSRDTGFILDAITTDLLYGGNERSITAGFFYYRFPSVATSTQRTQTTLGIRYSKILADFIVQNRLLETPRVSTNNEVGIKITNEANFTSSLFGTEVESLIVKSNFGIIGDIIRGGIEVTKRAVAKNKITDWSIENPVNVADSVQFVTTQSLTDYREQIGDGFELVAQIVSGGLSAKPQLDKSINDLVKVNNIAQITGSFVENYVTSSLSASFGLVVKIISNGIGSIPNVVPNTADNIFVGNILPQTGSFINPSYITSVSQSYSVVTNIVSGGLAVSPAVVKNTNGNVRTKNVQIFTSSLVATNTQVNFVSASFDIVLDIVENGTGSLPTLIGYTTPSTASVVLNAYQNLKNNIPFIQAETIAYLSSSWSEFQYNQASCSRDIGHIVSGAAEDLLYNANSSSIFNGKFYYDFPSAATVSGSGSPNVDAQLLPTLDGIRYASQLAQKVIVNTPFVRADVSDVEVANLLVSNKEFIRNETIEYISSSWSFFNYNDLTCKRDIGFIIDAVATDIIYGGNERVVNAGEYYYEIPSLATSTQLIQTLEAINYVSALSQKLIEGVEFITPDNDAVEASRLLLVNNELISREVVSYVSSSWSGVVYNELSCSRDIKHIINAARTDLVYGGNQRSVIAGEFYFLYPSRATVGGIPSEAAQLDPTITGIEYGSELSQKIVLNRLLTLVSSSKLEVVDVVRENKQFIKDNTIEYVNAFYPFLQYNEASCSRDVGFILDGVLTDLVYGGNQRNITSGDFYYRFPSPAITSAQKAETVDGILYAGEIAKLVSVNELIDGVEIGKNIDNTIKVTNTSQFTSSKSGSGSEVSNISSSFDLIRGIINDGVKSFTPTTATYNPANGDFVMTIASHSLTTENGVYLRPESFVFTCDMDGNRTEHRLPSVGQPAYDNRLQIQSITNNTVTINVGKSGPNLQFTPTNATYNPANGDFVITIGSHDLSVGEGIVITTGSIAFTCDMDDNQSIKSYPRLGIDPYAVRSIPITGVTATTITVNVGASGPNRYFTPSSASYNALTGDMIVTVGQHGLGVGRSVILATGSIAFTCDQDGNTTTHSYPRSGSDPYAERSIPITSVGFTQHTASNAPYNPSTGVVTLTIAGHGFSNGDYVKISDNSLTYTCVLDGNTVTKSYPRPGYDYPSGRWLNISNVTTNTFNINIGASSYIGEHTFVSATANGVQRQNGIFTINVGDAGSASGSIHTFVSASANAIAHLPQSVHTFVSASTGAIKHLPQSAHTFIRTTQNSVSTVPEIIINTENNIKVTTQTQFTSSKSGSVTEVLNVSSSFTLVTDIVESGVSSFTPTSASYNPANGEFLMTIPNHTLKVGNIIYLRDESFIFTCTMDGNRTEHALPSVGQPAYNNKLKIQSVTQNTITVNVGKSGPDVEFNPTDATYDPATGEFVVTVGVHDLSIGEGIVFATRSFAFTCDMDNNHSTKSYPRFGIDPFSVRSIPITAVTEDTLTFNVGASGPNKFFTPTSAIYDALTGDMVLTVGQHGLGIGRGVVLVTGSIAFTCDQDGNTTTHSYPRSGSDPFAGKSIDIIAVGVTQHTVTNAPYNAETGDVTITIVSHSFSNGDYIKLSDNSLTYTCVLDGNTVSKSYPRVGYDYPSGRWLSISGVTTNTFGINIGSSSYTNAHTFVTASVNGLERQTGTFTINVGDAGSASGSIHTFVSASANAVQHLPQTLHTFVSASAGALRHYPQAGHTFVRTTPNSVSTLPIVIENINNTIKVTNITQFTSSISASLQDIEFVSSSFGIVLDIVKNGSGSYTASVYGPPSSDVNTVAAYNLLKDNIPFIQGETIAYISSSWSDFEYNDLSCSRDIGFIVSGAAEDLLHGVDSASIVNGKYYFEFPSSATVSGSSSPTSASQLFPTLDGIRYASRLSEKIIQNIVFQTASLEVSASNVLIAENKQFIKEETIAYLSSSWSDFSYNEVTCKRDIGFILDAVRTDLVYGGNERSVNAGEFYYRFPSAATVSGSSSPTSASQLYPTLDGIRYASRLSDKLIQNTLLVTASLEVSASNVILNENKDFIKEETIAYLSSSWSDFSYNQETCKRDIGFIIDAVRTDLVYGGNERSVTAGDFYYRFPSAAVVRGTSSPTTAAQLFPTLDGIRYAGDVSQKLVSGSVFQTASLQVSASVNLIRKNRTFIRREVIEYVSSSWSQVVYNEESCSRDTGFLIDAAVTDLLYGGEERSVNAGDFYYRFPSRATVAGVPSEEAQLDPTLSGVRYAGGLASKIVLNQQFTFPSQSVLNGRSLLLANKQLVQKETIAFLSSSWSGLKYNEVSCSRDLGFILDAVSTDLVYGGNESSIEAGNYYYLKPSVTIIDSYADNFGQRQQTVDGINFAKGVSEKVVAQTQLVFPGVRRLEAAQRLVAAKEELKRRALSYTNGAFPALVYNEASCSRDTGLIVDALATDLIYGGNERGIEAATSYFTGQYGSAATVVNSQRLETLETNRYLRTRAEFIAANAPKEDFGSLIVATGIDYSYNGSGVTFKALPPNQGGSGIPNPDFEITELGGGRIFFTSGNQDGDFRIGTGLTINQSTGTLVGRTFSKSLFSLVTPFSLALEG
jgi:hypothetical protein